MRAAAGGVTVLECLRRERLHQPFQKTVSGHQFRQMWDHDMVEMLDEEIVDDDHLLAAQLDCFELVRILGYESFTLFEFVSDPL